MTRYAAAVDARAAVLSFRSGTERCQSAGPGSISLCVDTTLYLNGRAVNASDDVVRAVLEGELVTSLLGDVAALEATVSAQAADAAVLESTLADQAARLAQMESNATSQQQASSFRLACLLAGCCCLVGAPSLAGAHFSH